MAETSTKPYMIRAIYEWCCDNGYTPYLAVRVDGRTRVPVQHVRNGEIVLNISPLATHAAQLGNELIEFQARFNGVPEHISVPVGNVLAIYARETGSGMAFSPEIDEDDDEEDAADEAAAQQDDLPAAPPSGGGEVLAFSRAPARKPALRAAEPAPSPSPSSADAGKGAGASASGAGSDATAPAAQGGQGAAGPKAGAKSSKGGQNAAGKSGPDEPPPPAGGGRPRLVRIK